MASVSYNGESIIWKIPVTNLSPFPNTNVIVSDVMSGGMQYASHTVTKGTFDPLTGVWTVGDMSGESTETLTITVVVTDITQAPFTNTATVTGSLIEANTLDNSFTQTVTVENCPPTGAGLPDFTGCLCIDVSLNDTKCTKGVTEWRLIPSSVTNSTSYHWDQLTGKGSFTPIDPTLPITGAYDLFCVQGTSITQISCNVLFTIYPQLEDKSIFDHTISHVKITDLTPADIAVLQSQNPDLVVADYCWQVVKNANGVVTSGIPLDCDPAIDNRTFLICTAVPCTNTPCPDCPILTLPADVQAQILADTPGYSPEKGDVVYIQHPNATSIYTFNGSGWIKSSCGCVYKISQNVNNDLSLGTDNAPFFDLSVNQDFIDLENRVDDLERLVHLEYCSNVDCDIVDNGCASCPQGSLPNDVVLFLNTLTYYTPVAGNTISVQHPNATSTYTFNGTSWDRTCGCTYKISQDSGNLLTLGTDNAPKLSAIAPYPTAVSVTGTTTKTLTITMSDSSTLTTTFTDIDTDTDTDTTYTFEIVGNDLVITPVSGTPITLTLPSAVEVCQDISLEVLPQISDVGSVYTLVVSGIDNTSPLWNTWVWQYSDKYASGSNLNTTPTWIDGQTGGITYTQPTDDVVIRVTLVNNSCQYTSNQSGYIPKVLADVNSGVTVTYSPHSNWTIGYTPTTQLVTQRITAWGKSVGSQSLLATSTPTTVNIFADEFYTMSPSELGLDTVNNYITNIATAISEKLVRVDYSFTYEAYVPNTAFEFTIFRIPSDFLANTSSLTSLENPAQITGTIHKSDIVHLNPGDSIMLQYVSTEDIKITNLSIMVDFIYNIS